MRYPIIDAMASMKHYAERVQSSLARIQDLLLRNGSVKSASSEQQFRLQKVVTSTAQIVLDRVAGEFAVLPCEKLIQCKDFQCEPKFYA